jgi:hypothetical protein
VSGEWDELLPSVKCGHNDPDAGARLASVHKYPTDTVTNTTTLGPGLLPGLANGAMRHFDPYKLPPLNAGHRCSS